MNNDDMSDEEFDAFLRGEGDLSLRLQALSQPSSSAQLDAAISGHVQSALAHEARPVAANDAARRWRIPAGIAAGVLAGVLGHQAYQASGEAARTDTTLLEAPRAQPQPQPQQNTAAAPMAPPAEAPPPPPMVVAQARVPVEAARASKPQPRPAPAAIAAAAEPAEPAVLEKRRADAYGASPMTVIESPPAPAPAAAAPRMAAAPPAQAKSSTYVVITGSSIKREDSQHARNWLSVIDAMLKADLKRDALAEWRKFDAAYPDYDVPADLQARIDAIKPDK